MLIMTIISLKFMLFVIIMMLLYFLVPKKIRWCILLIGSYIYYFIASAKLTIFLVVTTFTIYWSGILMNKVDEKKQISCNGKDKEARKVLKREAEKKKKIIIFITIAINVGILLFLKYGNFISKNINEILNLLNINTKIPFKKVILPLGISYYTLQALSYIVDVYRGKYKAEKNWGKIALFLSFFPQMLEGPIGRYEDLAEQLYKPHDFNYKRVKYAIQIILWGLFKKMVIADRAALYVNEVFNKYNEYSGIVIVMAIILYTIQIYAEFSGCIDIVRGVAQIFGVTLAENFKRLFFQKVFKNSGEDGI